MDELIIKERETKQKLVDLTNNSGLPAFVLKSMLKELLAQIELLENQQYIQAKKKIGGIQNGHKDK